MSPLRIAQYNGTGFDTIYGAARPGGWTLGVNEPTDLNSGTGVVGATPTTVWTGGSSITTAGSFGLVTYDSIIFNQKMTILAANVRFRNCIFRGDVAAPTSASALVICYSQNVLGAYFEFCDFIPQTPSYNWNGIQGHDFTIYRSRMRGTVDMVSVVNPNSGHYGDAVNVYVLGSLLGFSSFFASDPNHSNGSHDDICQMNSGSVIHFIGNSMHAVRDTAVSQGTLDAPQMLSAFQLTPNLSAITGLVITDNWIYGGQVTFQFLGSASYEANMAACRCSVLRNKFDHGQRYGSGDSTTTIEVTASMYDAIAGSDTIAAAFGVGTSDANRYMDNGHEITVLRVTR